MHALSGPIDSLRAKLMEWLRDECESVGSLQAFVTRRAFVPKAISLHDLKFFYPTAKIDAREYEASLETLTEILKKHDISLSSVPVSRAGYEKWLADEGLYDLPDRRFVYLAVQCGHDNPPDTVSTNVPFAPMVIKQSGPDERVLSTILFG